MNDYSPSTSFHKPRPDSRLKNLSEPHQARIAEFARTHSLTQTAQWLVESGLTTSRSALSQFLRWYRLKQDVARNESALHDRLADLIRNDPGRTTRRLDELGHAFFTMSAIEKQDCRAWCQCQNIAIRKGHF